MPPDRFFGFLTMVTACAKVAHSWGMRRPYASGGASSLNVLA